MMGMQWLPRRLPTMFLTMCTQVVGQTLHRRRRLNHHLPPPHPDPAPCLHPQLTPAHHLLLLPIPHPQWKRTLSRATMIPHSSSPLLYPHYCHHRRLKLQRPTTLSTLLRTTTTIYPTPSKPARPLRSDTFPPNLPPHPSTLPLPLPPPRTTPITITSTTKTTKSATITIILTPQTTMATTPTITPMPIPIPLQMIPMKATKPTIPTNPTPITTPKDRAQTMMMRTVMK